MASSEKSIWQEIGEKSRSPFWRLVSIVSAGVVFVTWGSALRIITDDPAWIDLASFLLAFGVGLLLISANFFLWRRTSPGERAGASGKTESKPKA